MIRPDEEGFTRGREAAKKKQNGSPPMRDIFAPSRLRVNIILAQEAAAGLDGTPPASFAPLRARHFAIHARKRSPSACSNSPSHSGSGAGS